MPHMLGENFLPESVQSRRRQFREKVNNLRQPIKNFRENTVPGPNVVGKAESQLQGLKNQFFSREGVLSRIKSFRSQQSGSGSGSSSQTQSQSGSQPNTPST